jgi:hypothetical protein
VGAVVFGGPVWPIGWSVGFLEAPYPQVLAVTLEWRQRLESRLRQREHGRPILEMLRTLTPLATPWNRELVVEMHAGWTAHFTNDHLGGDSSSWVGYLQAVLRCRGVIGTHIPRGQYRYPATQFELLGPSGTPPLGFVRTISCGIYDSGRWNFEASGTPQPLEDLRAYCCRARWLMASRTGWLVSTTRVRERRAAA